MAQKYPPRGFFTLTAEQEKQVLSDLRKARTEFEAHGGKYCHCGGLIYPNARHTCTHGGEPLTGAEIDAIREGWRAEKKEE